MDSLVDTPEPGLPLCTAEDLWATGDPVFKYYKDPAKTSRSTKNFKTSYEANERLVKDGSVGLVKEVKPKPKACNYCNARSVCTQYSDMARDGLI